MTGSTSQFFVIGSIVLAYFAFMAIVGVITSKQTTSIENFTVGGRKAGAWLSAFSYGTTYFSAVVFIGYAGGSGWSFGLWAALIGLGNAIIGSLLAWLVLAKRTRKYTQKYSVSSMPRLFEVRYKSKAMKTVSAVVIFVFLIPYSASVFTGLSYVCEKVLLIPYEICMAIIAVAAILLLVLGGYLAMVNADFIQGFVMIAGVIALIIYMLRSDNVVAVGGLRGIWSIMDDAGIAHLNGTQIKNLVALIFLTSLGTWGLPQMVHKYYGLVDDNAVKRGTVISTVFSLIISVGAYFNGSLSRAFFTDSGAAVTINGATLNPVPLKDQIVPEMLVNSGIPVFLAAIILVLLISASVSTLTGVTLTAASSVSLDIIKSNFKPDMDDKKSLSLTRLLCLVFIVFSYCVAVFKIEAIINLMAFSWGALAGAFLGPYLVGLYMKKANKVGAWCGLVTGLGTALITNTVDAVKIVSAGGAFNLPNAPINGLAAMIISVIACIIGSLIGEKFGVKSGDEAYSE